MMMIVRMKEYSNSLLIIFFISFVIGQSLQEPLRFDDFSVYRIIPYQQDHIQYLQQLAANESFFGENHVNFWKFPTTSLNHSVDVMFSPKAKEELLPGMRQMNFDIRRMINNVQERIDAENELKGRQMTNDKGQFSRNYAQFFSTYQRYPQIIAALDALADDHPELASIETIGQSTEKRALKVIKISRGTNEHYKKRKIWIDGGFHAREWISPATALFVAHKLVTEDGRDPTVVDILDKFDVHILPLANPDGYEYTHDYNRMWRKTRSRSSSRWGFLCRGTDPNRNFGYKWRTGGSSNNPCSDIYAGEKAFSEPETIAIRDYILKEAPWDVYLTLHSYSQLVLSPWGWTEDLPQDYLELYRVAQLASQSMQKLYGTQYNYGATTRVLYVASGGSDDWAYGEVGVKYSYTFELRDTGDSGFLLPDAQIVPQGLEFWEGFVTLLKELR
ncbi:carboxypeptidase B-like [Brevipalpus obovatus]|uniref:carboxypeptidase B-like n=1 Tax=Brevipalpus obovatus TaxID=246614 RepID=UPI003D9EB10B